MPIYLNNKKGMKNIMRAYHFIKSGVQINVGKFLDGLPAHLTRWFCSSPFLIRRAVENRQFTAGFPLHYFLHRVAQSPDNPLVFSLHRRMGI